jgi:hypothetical protein
MSETSSKSLDTVMPSLLIKDLPDSTELDREAMLAIVGGARSGTHQNFRLRPLPRPGTVTRIVSYPPGFAPSAGSDASSKGTKKPA